MDEASVRLNWSENGRIVIGRSYHEWPTLGRQVLEEIYDEVLAHKYRLYPKAIRPQGENGYVEHCERVLKQIIARVQLPSSVETSLIPDKALLIATSAAAFMLGQVVSYDVPAQQMLVPEGFDPDGLLDTVAAHYYNYGYDKNALGEVFARMFYVPFGWYDGDIERPYTQGQFADHAVQEANYVFWTSMGPGPAAVLRIVEDGDVPRDMALAWDIGDTKAAKEAFADRVKAIYEENSREHSKGFRVESLASRLAQGAGEAEIMQWMKGRWITLLREIRHIWPPEIATAHMLLDDLDRRDWPAKAIAAARRASDRERKRERDALSKEERLDVGYGDDDSQPGRHELIEDPASDMGVDRSMEEFVLEMNLTKLENKVLFLLYEGRSQREIASHLAISEARVSQIRQRMRGKAQALSSGSNADHASDLALEA